MASADNERAAEKISLIFRACQTGLVPGNEFMILKYRQRTATEGMYSFHMMEKTGGTPQTASFWRVFQRNWYSALVLQQKRINPLL